MQALGSMHTRHQPERCTSVSDTLELYGPFYRDHHISNNHNHNNYNNHNHNHDNHHNNHHDNHDNHNHDTDANHNHNNNNDAHNLNGI